MDGGPNTLVGPASADVARHAVVDVGVGWGGFAGEQRRRRHDLTGLAVATLRDVDLHPRLLNRVIGALRQSLDRGHAPAGDRRGGRDARAHGGAVDVNGAGPADRDAASVLGSRQVERLPKHPQERHLGRDVDLPLLAVDRERDHGDLLARVVAAGHDTPSFDDCLTRRAHSAGRRDVPSDFFDSSRAAGEVGWSARDPLHAPPAARAAAPARRRRPGPRRRPLAPGQPGRRRVSRAGRPPPATAFGVGIAVASLAGPEVLWAAWLAAVAIGVGLLALGRSRGAAAALLVGVAAVGALRGREAPLPPDHVARLDLPMVVRIEGRLAVEPTRSAPARPRLLLDAEQADGAPASGRIQGTVYGVPPPLTEGQRIAASLKVHPATGFRNPGTFDYAAHLAREDVRVVATARAESITPLDDPSPPWSVRVKRASITAMERTLPPTSAALLAGLLLGDRAELPRDIDDAFRRAGVYHVLAVSGFNVALLAAAVWALCRLARLPRRASAATAIVVVIGFALVVGPSPSVLRAVVMAVLVLAALLLERDASVTNSLALAALAILAVRPGDLFDPGFQLSFAATLGIVGAPLPRGAVLRALGVSAAPPPA